MEENILEIVEKSCQIHRDVIGMTFAKLLSFCGIKDSAEHILHWWEAALMNGSAPTWLYFSWEILLYRWMQTCQFQNYMNF